MALAGALTSDGARALAGPTSRARIADALVPVRGFVPLLKFLREFFDLKLEVVVGDPHYSQVRVAFEIRHKFEHTNGKVDKRFVDEVKNIMGKTSWKDDAERLSTVGSKIEIRYGDVERTSESMTHFARKLAESVRKLAES